MSELALPQLFGGRVSPVEATERFLDLRVSDDIPTNEYGIVVLENPQPCIGEDCHLRGEREECYIDLDHLHHSGAYYEHKGALAEEFREEEVLTRWVYRCIHERKHKRYPHNVPLPRLKVMQKAVPEARLLRQIEANYRARMSFTANLRQRDYPRWARLADQKNLDLHNKEKKKLIKSVENIEFLPQEIVTGALLLAAPGHARSRLIENPAYMLPGTIRRHEVVMAWRAADEMLEYRAELSRSYAQELQMDREFEEAATRAA